MDKVLHGVYRFRKEVYPKKEGLFKELAFKQNPDTLFITCSDSRIDPSMLVQSEPGELFIIRNAGNIVPPHGVAHDGVLATIDYAVEMLNVKDIIVCGHSNCGAIYGLAHPDVLRPIPSVRRWLDFALAAKAVADTEGLTHDSPEYLKRCTEANVVIQLTHLKTIPSVAARLRKGELTLHGWVYFIDKGEVHQYDEESDSFIALESVVSIS